MLLFAVAFALWLRLPFFSEDPLDVCPGYVAVEWTSYSTSHTLWPPGATDCEWTTPAGEVRHSTYLPWSEWLILALVFTGVALVYASVYAGSSNPERRFFVAVAAPAGVLALVFLVFAGAWATILVPPLLVGVPVAWRWGRV